MGNKSEEVIFQEARLPARIEGSQDPGDDSDLHNDYDATRTQQEILAQYRANSKWLSGLLCVTPSPLCKVCLQSA